jgi:acyl carrier protein phosphodiesterase
MIAENWLVLYRTTGGLEYILSQMDKRSKGISKMRFATKELIENYPDFETQFTAFFEDLKEHIIRFIKTGRFLLKSY